MKVKTQPKVEIEVLKTVCEITLKPIVIKDYINGKVPQHGTAIRKWRLRKDGEKSPTRSEASSVVSVDDGNSSLTEETDSEDSETVVRQGKLLSKPTLLLSPDMLSISK